MSNPLIAGLAQLRTMVPELRPTHVWDKAVDVSLEEQKLTRLLIKAGSRQVVDDYEARVTDEDAPLPYFLVTDINVTGNPLIFKVAAADALALTTNTQIRKSDTAIALITDITSGDPKYTITIDTNLGLAVGDVLQQSAPAFEERSAAPAAVTFNPTTRLVYVQTIRVAWGESRHVRSVTSFLRETRVAANRRQGFRLMRQLCESALIISEHLKVANPLRYYLHGLLEQNSVNVFDVADEDGAFTYEALEDFVVQANRSRDQLNATTSPKVASEIRKIVWKKSMNAVVEGEFMGVPVTNVRVGNKKIRLIESENYVGGLQSRMDVFDNDALQVLTTKDREANRVNWFVLESNAETPGTDGSLNILTCDIGLLVRGRERQFAIRNLVKGTV